MSEALVEYVLARNSDDGTRVTHKRRTDAAVRLAEAMVMARYGHQLKEKRSDT